MINPLHHIYFPLIFMISARSMIEKSFSWAKARGLTRDNPVHGEEEARLVLEDGFQHDDERGEMRHLKGEGHLEDPVSTQFVYIFSTNLNRNIPLSNPGC